MMNRSILFTAALALPLAFPVAAYAQGSAGGPAAQPIESLDSSLINVMKAGSQKQSFMQRYQMLQPVVERALDLPAILQGSVGLLWQQIPEAQKTQLLKVFTQYTVASYVNSFDSYNGQSIRLLPGGRHVGSEEIVQTEIVPQSGNPTKLNYVMTDNNGQWQATDVLFEGTISKVAMARSDFSSLVQPGNATRLISVLQHKVASLSGGALKT